MKPHYYFASPPPNWQTAVWEYMVLVLQLPMIVFLLTAQALINLVGFIRRKI